MHRIAVVAVSVWLVFVAAEPARASAILTMIQDPTGVSVAGSGSFNVNALTLAFDVSVNPAVT